MDLSLLLQQLNWRAVLDIVLVAFLLYQVLSILRGSRAVQILIGLLLIFIAYAVSSLLQLDTINWIVSKIYSSLIIVIIVLFQDDIRRLLSRMGRGPFSSRLESESGLRVIEEVVSAAKNLSHDRLGAIVVFERGVSLERLHDYGILVDSIVTEEILICVFQSFSPLHDGAVLIRHNRISAASTHLPLSKNADLTKRLGTRHSASLGISEETDAVALVVSEETGNISVAVDGELYRQPSPEAAKRMLIQLLLPTQKTSRIRGYIQRWLRPKSRMGWGDRKAHMRRRIKFGLTKMPYANDRGYGPGRPGATHVDIQENFAVRIPNAQGGVDISEISSDGVIITQGNSFVEGVHQTSFSVHDYIDENDETHNAMLQSVSDSSNNDSELMETDAVYRNNQAL